VAKIVDPDHLDIQSTVTVMPQCVDNQFLTKDLFARLAKGRRALRNILESSISGSPDGDATHFFEAHKTEYVRSLIYARRLLINRAALWNNPVFIASLLGDDRDSVVALLASGVISPCLLKETSFDEQPGFETLDLGVQAMTDLGRDPALADMTCVRLGGLGQASNERALDTLTGIFRNLLQFPVTAEYRQVQRIARALFDDPEETPTADVDALANRLIQVGEWVRLNRPNRNEIYEEFITYGPPTTTPYRAEPLTFELKKWVDIVYNSNLPFFLGARTFTPHGMPTPLDVELDWAFRVGGAPTTPLDNFTDVADEIRQRARSVAELRAWDALENTLALPVPAPHELSHRDVVEVRALPSWDVMMTTMEAHLAQPLSESTMKVFWETYNEFLRELNKWWLAKGRPERQRFAAGVARVWRWGEWFVGLVQLGNFLLPILPGPGVPLPILPVDRPVRVLVETGLFLYQRAGVEWRRSQAVRGLTKVQLVQYADLKRTQEVIERLYPDLGPHFPGWDGMADPAVEETPA
jgi:hypothetical protein